MTNQNKTYGIQYRNQQAQFSFLSGLLVLACKLIVSSSEGIAARLFLIYLVRFRNASSTLRPLLALTSKNSILCFSASALPSSYSTSRSAVRSHFKPTNILHTFSLVLPSICLIHPVMFLKLCLLLIEQARIMPAAPLQQVWVMFLNLYCPAVSQTCSFTLAVSTLTVLSLKSTPMVATQLSLKTPSQNLVRRMVLPTPLSPMMMILARNSTQLDFVISNLIIFFQTTRQLSNQSPSLASLSNHFIQRTGLEWLVMMR